MIKVMLIDDEPEIRKLLHKMVEKQPGYQVVSECGDFSGAIVEFTRYRPDVVFVDIDLNGEDGLECAKVLTELNPKLKVIFATAHSEYMANAFEIYAFDYLVKPFNMERVARTLERIRETCSGNGDRGTGIWKDEASGSVRTDRILTERVNTGGKDNYGESDKITRSEQYRGKLLIKGKDQACLLDVEDIVLIERVGSSTNIVTAGEQYKTSISLSEMETKLDAGKFMRCHKSYIINLSKVTRMEPYGRWTYVVKFKDCEETALMTSQNYEEIKKMFS